MTLATATRQRDVPSTRMRAAKVFGRTVHFVGLVGARSSKKPESIFGLLRKELGGRLEVRAQSKKIPLKKSDVYYTKQTTRE